MLNEVRSNESFVNLMLHCAWCFIWPIYRVQGEIGMYQLNYARKTIFYRKKSFIRRITMYEIVKYKNYSEYFVHYWIILMCCINNYAYPALIENIPIKLHPFLGLQYLPLSLRFSFPALFNIFIIMLSVP